jgi:hypothetical protein
MRCELRTFGISSSFLTNLEGGAFKALGREAIREQKAKMSGVGEPRPLETEDMGKAKKKTRIYCR